MRQRQQPKLRTHQVSETTAGFKPVTAVVHQWEMFLIQGKQTILQQQQQKICQGATSGKYGYGVVATTPQKAVFEALLLRLHSFVFPGILTRWDVLLTPAVLNLNDSIKVKVFRLS